MINFFADRRSVQTLLRLFFFGISAGIVNGLLGAGGGILLVFALAPLFSHSRDGRRDVFANALAVMFPVSIVSMIGYLRAGRFSPDGFGIYLLPCVLGGFVGAILLSRLNLSILQKIFALIVVFSGAYMVAL